MMSEVERQLVAVDVPWTSKSAEENGAAIVDATAAMEAHGGTVDSMPPAVSSAVTEPAFR